MKSIILLSLFAVSCHRPTQQTVGNTIVCNGGTVNLNNSLGSNNVLTIEKGTGVCWFDSPLQVGTSNVEIHGIGKPVLAYKGTSGAVLLGKSGTVVYQARLDNVVIDLENAANDAIGIIGTSLRNSQITNVEIKTGQGAANSRNQIAVKLDGNGTFNAMNDFYSVYIHGDFAIGYLITGANSFNSTNSTHIVSGGVFNTAQNKAGSIGLRIQYGDTTRVTHTSIENWGTGTRVESNFNGPIAGRFENNQVDWEVRPNVQNTSFEGSVFNNRSDSGIGTTYTSNGSLLESKVGGSMFIPSLKSTGGLRHVCTDVNGKLVGC